MPPGRVEQNHPEDTVEAIPHPIRDAARHPHDDEPSPYVRLFHHPGAPRWTKTPPAPASGHAANVAHRACSRKVPTLGGTAVGSLPGGSSPIMSCHGLMIDSGRLTVAPLGLWWPIVVKACDGVTARFGPTPACRRNSDQ
ncbi:hypothetical protein GCM10028775_48660 [Catellatospora paridis]